MHERVENGNKLIKVNSFPFDKVYFGMPQYTGKTMKLNRPLFVTPYKGIASIFAVSRNEKVRSIIRGSGYKNLGYDEWGLPKSQLQDYLTELHIQVQGGKDFPEQTFDLSGYVYEIDGSKLKDNIYQHPWMNKDKEFLIADIDEVKFSSIRKVNIKTYVKHYDSRPIKESYQIEGDTMKHDGFEEIRALLTGEELIEESTSRSLKDEILLEYRHLPKDVSNKTKDDDKSTSVGNLNKIKQILRKHVNENSFSLEIFDESFIKMYKLDENPSFIKEHPIDERKAFNLIKPIAIKADEYAKSNNIKAFHQTIKKLFKLIGIKDPDARTKFTRRNFYVKIDGRSEEIRFNWTERELTRLNISDYYFFHFSKKPIVGNIILSSHSTPVGKYASDFYYATPRVFMFAIKKEQLKSMDGNSLRPYLMDIAMTYGSFRTFCLPTEVYVDNGEERYGPFIPVFTPKEGVRTYQPKIDGMDESNIVEKYPNKNKRVHNYSESYIDETIERFDAFMEEFDLNK